MNRVRRQSRSYTDDGCFFSLSRIKFPAVTIVLRLHTTSIVFMVYFVGALSDAVFSVLPFSHSFSAQKRLAESTIAGILALDSIVLTNQVSTPKFTL